MAKWLSRRSPVTPSENLLWQDLDKQGAAGQGWIWLDTDRHRSAIW
jgi:hypothetical protein